MSHQIYFPPRNHFNPVIQQDYWCAVGGGVMEQEAGPRWRSFLSCISEGAGGRSPLEPLQSLYWQRYDRHRWLSHH